MESVIKRIDPNNFRPVRHFFQSSRYQVELAECIY